MAFEMEAKQRESQQGGEQQVAAAWWEELDDRGAGLLAGKCHGAASVELRAEAAEPLSFDLGCFVFVFLENLLLPLSILPQLCVGRWRHNLVGKSYFPASKEFASDDELLWALKLTRTGFASSKVHALVFGNTWGMVAAVGYCGVRWWHDAPARYYFLLVLLFQVLLRSQWAIKYAYRRDAAERRLRAGTSLDRRAEELLFGFMPLAPWLCIVELRLAALIEGLDLDEQLEFHGGAAEAAEMFPQHVMRWLPDAVCRAGASEGWRDWDVGTPKLDEQRGVFSMSAAALIFRALVHHSKVIPVNGQPPVKVEFHSIDGWADFVILVSLFALGMLPLAAAQLDGTSTAAFTPGAIVLAIIYFVSAPLGVRGFLNAVFVNIRRRIQQQELMGALLSGQPSICGRVATPQLVRSEHSIAAWLRCRAVLLRSFASIQRRTEAMAAIVFTLCIALFSAVAIPAFGSANRISLRENAFLLLLTASLIIVLGSFMVAVSMVGDTFNHIATAHEKELGKLGLEGRLRGDKPAAGSSSSSSSLATASLLAQGVVRATQLAEPLSVLGLIELNISSAKAVLFFMTVDLGIVATRIDWDA